MMIKKNLKTMIITSIVILIPILVGLYFWDQLPDQIATHFNANNQPDGWSSKGFAVVGLPLLLLVVHWFCVAVTGTDPKSKNISDKMMLLVMWICPVVSIFGCGSTYLYALDNTVKTTESATLLIGCVLLVVGNYLPKMKQSYTLGLKLPWTLNSEENWNRTHRFGGYTFMIGGFIMIIASLLGISWLVFVALVVASVLPTIYSYVLYKKGI